jgi:hypothetical protein
MAGSRHWDCGTHPVGNRDGLLRSADTMNGIPLAVGCAALLFRRTENGGPPAIREQRHQRANCRVTACHAAQAATRLIDRGQGGAPDLCSAAVREGE